MDPQLIDYNARFAEDYFKWCGKHPEIMRDEEKVADLYFVMFDAWLDKPKKWLDGLSPNQYFDGIRDARMLVSMMIEYVRAEIERPDPLIRRILEEADEVYPIFLAILDRDKSAEMPAEELQDVQGNVISLITEMQKEHPYERYIQMLEDIREDCYLAEEVTTALGEAGDGIRELLLAAYPNCEGHARLCLMDLLSACGPDEETLHILIEEFQRPGADLAFVSGCLGRYGDAGALPYLKRALDRPDLEYFLFREIKNAIEAISGEEIEERDFTGDQLYDFLAKQDE